MRKQTIYSLFVFVLLFSLFAAACTPAVTPEPPKATEAVKATEAKPAEPTKVEVKATEVVAAEPTKAEVKPTEVAKAEGDFKPLKVEAADCKYGGEFKSIEAVDEHTVKFTLCYPDPAFPSKVAFSVFSIADTDDINANAGDSVKMGEKANGSGPYMLKEWVKGDHITLEANPDYWGEKAKIKTVIFRWSDQAAQRLLELESGTADGIDNPQPEDFEKIKGDTNLALYPREALNIFYLGMNNTIAPFGNEKVRQAFAMAIDRSRIIEQYYPDGSTVAENFVPESFNPGFSKDIKWYEYNKEEAKKLLEEAGVKDLEVELAYRNVVRVYLPAPDKVATEIQAQLAEIGVTVKIKQMESTTFLDDTSQGKVGFYLLGWGADYPDATNFFDYHFANEQNKLFGTLHDDIVKAIRAGGQTADATERQAAYDTVNELLKKYAVMIPVAHGASATAYKANVKGAHSSPLTNEIFSVMDNGADQFVWVQNGEPGAIWCADETDGEALRACDQLYDALLSYKVGGVEVQPGLAEKYEPNKDATEWTFTLRDGVKFHGGAALDANDVVNTYVAQWDAKSPNHKGRTGTFEYFGAFFGKMLNAE